MNNDAVKKGRSMAILTLIGSFILIFGIMGVGLSSLSLYVVPMMTKLQVEATGVSFAFSLITIISFVCALFYFKVSEVINFKLMIFLGTVCAALGFVCFALAQNIVLIYLGGILFGFGTGFSGYISTQGCLAQWFVKGKGIVVGITGCASGFAATIFSPIFAGIINDQGYETAAFITAGILVAIGAITGFGMIRKSPQKYGVVPFGGTAESIKVDASAENKVVVEVPGYTLKQALKTNQFWLALIVSFATGVVTQAVSTQSSAIIMSKGFSIIEAGTALSFYSIVNMVARLIYGAIYDKWGLTPANLIYGVITAAGYTILATNDSWGAVVAAMMMVALHPSVSSGVTIYQAARLFGRKDINGLNGWQHAVSAIGSAVGPMLSSAIYAATGSYTPALFTVAGIVVIYNICGFFAMRKKNWFIEPTTADAKKVVG